MSLKSQIYASQSKVTGKAPGVEIEIEIGGGRAVTAMAPIGRDIGLIQLYYLRQSTTVYNM